MTRKAPPEARKLELDPGAAEAAWQMIPQPYRDAAAQVKVPREYLETVPAPRYVPGLIQKTRKLDGATLIANWMQALSARAMDPGRWWWNAYEALKTNPTNEVSFAKKLAKAAIDDLCKATRSAKKHAGFLRMPKGIGQMPVHHPTDELAWLVCLHPADEGGIVFFPHARLPLPPLAPGDAVLFPRCGGMGITPVEQGYQFLLVSHEPPTPRLVLPWGSAA